MLIKKILPTVNKLLSVVGLLLLLTAVTIIFIPVAREYLTLPKPVGGDYYNALTYATQFAKHLPFPPRGWLSMWHEGIPIIGGYPVTAFYLMSPLFAYFEPAQAMEIFSVGALLMFLLATGVLFRLLSGSTAFAFLLTLIVFITKATFYQLFAEGLVIATAMQWTLPMALFWLYLFLQTQKFKYLIIAGAVSGLAILFHPAMGILIVLLPLVTWLGAHFAKLRAYKKFVTSLFTVTSLALVIGSPTLYNLIRFTIYSTGSGKCDNPQCWGLYPDHFRLWLSLFTPGLLFSLFLLLGVIKLFKKRVSLLPTVESLLAAGILCVYIIAAYFHLIDSTASAIFPRRTFWALNVMLLVSVCIAYRTLMTQFSKGVSYSVSTLIILILFILFWQKPTILDLNLKSMSSDPGTIPADIDEFIIPKYKKQELSNLLPEKVITKAAQYQYRFDSNNSQVINWWNTILQMPTTRGYSNSPSGVNSDWLYYFQVGTAENEATLEPELVRNRTLFLLDYYAVGLYENSGRGGSGSQLGYPQSILADPSVVVNQERVRDIDFFELSSDLISPIVSPTNSIPFLVVSDDPGYETVVRALSYTGLTSQVIIPVRGPPNFDSLTIEQLATFPALFLYRYQGNSWQRLDNYIKNGGTVIIDIATAKDRLPAQFPTFFPASRFRDLEVKQQLNFKNSPASLLEEVEVSNFSPFTYQGGPWKLRAAENLAAGVDTILQTDEHVFLVTGEYGKGKVLVSGLNLPFHIIDTQNFDEVNLFKNILSLLIPKNAIESPSFSVTRPVPETITVAGTSRGIFFKENYDSGWTAKTKTSALPIYPAGTQFMYIPIPASLTHSSVNLSYRGTVLTWAIFFTSIGTFVLTIVLFILPQPLVNRLSTSIVAVLKKPWHRVSRAEDDEY